MDFTSRYVAFLRRFLDLKKPLRVIFDFSNGPAARIVPCLLAGNRFVTPIFLDRRLSGNFPGHGPNPMDGKGILHLHREVLRRRADMGVIFDADGDRAFFADDRGRWVSPHVVAHLFFSGHQPPFVADQIVFKTLEKAGLLNKEGTHLSRVGSFFIKGLMKKVGASVGAEYSGHYYFKEFFYLDSGIVAAIQMMNLVSQFPYSLSDFCELLPQKIYSNYFNVRSRDPGKLIGKVMAEWRKRGCGINRLDGVACDCGDTWFIARPSNTEPLLRFFVGATNLPKLRRTLNKLRKSL